MTQSQDQTAPETLFARAMDYVAEGDLKGAGALLARVVKEGEGEISGRAHNQLGLIALRSGDSAKARGHFEAALKLCPPNPALIMNLGVAQFATGETGQSIETLQALVRDHPEIAEARFHLGEALLAGGNAGEALAAFETYLSANPGSPGGLIEAGMCKEQLGDRAGAEKAFEKAKTLAPEHYITLYKAAERAGGDNRVKQARELLARAGRILPKDPIPHHMVAVFYQNLGDKDKAEAFLKKSLALAPTPESYGQLAALYEKSNQLNDAWATANLGLRAFPDDPYLVLILARVERRAGKYQQARDRLLGIQGKTGDDTLETQIGFQLGWLFDQAGEVEKAFECYKTAKETAARTAPRDIDKEVSFAYIRAMEKIDLKALPAFPYKRGGDEPLEVAFLIGFPRSGTTLLNQILDCHPALAAMEEVPSLPAPAALVEALKGGYPAALKDLDKKTVEAMRAAYFRQIREFCDFTPEQIVIDKLPLNLVHLPLIWTLFPNAKVILALRHPFASVLSNFMHNFKLNNAMANMFSLDDITRYYAGVMALWGHFRAKRDFTFHAIKYEDVVANVEAEGKKLCAFLSIEWSPDMLNFSRHAQKKGLINTPSYHQVTQPLYSDSLERWRRYEKYLSPYGERLLPFVRAFGYKV